MLRALLFCAAAHGTTAGAVCGDHVLLQRGQATVARWAAADGTQTPADSQDVDADWKGGGDDWLAPDLPPGPPMLRASEPIPAVIYFDAIIRDFKADHADMQFHDGHTKGLVQKKLGPDKKPVFNGGPQLSNETNFYQWYNDDPEVNKRIEYMLKMKWTDGNTYVHDDGLFFPIDGRGWKDSTVALDGQEHNLYFTVELHAQFVYRGGEIITFRGDDDVWVFINGDLVIDLGGVHHPMEGSVALDELELTRGERVEMSFFFAERRCCGSNFRLETSIIPVMASCKVWGDPHVDVFDHGHYGQDASAPVSIFSAGDFWLVKSSEVQIQARYGPTQFTVGGQAALLALAVSGPIVWNHTLVIEPMGNGGKVTWDGEEILDTLPSRFIHSYMKMFFTEGKKHIDAALQGYPVNLIRAYMYGGVHLVVNRWPQHIDAIIRMPQQPGGQDGHCGNNNLDLSDDTQEAILERMGAPIPSQHSFFPSDLALGNFGVHSEAQALTLDDCAPALRLRARELCEAAVGGVSNQAKASWRLDTCIFDVCFGGKEFAAEDAILEDESANA